MGIARTPDGGSDVTTRDRVHLGAIAVGVVVDFVGSGFSFAALVVVAAGAAAASGGAISTNTVEQWPGELWFIASGSVVGLAWSAVGGYVAGVFAKFDQVRHAAWVGGVSMALGGAFLLAGGGTSALSWFDALSQLFVFPSALAGGWLARRRSRMGQRNA